MTMGECKTWIDEQYRTGAKMCSVMQYGGHLWLSSSAGWKHLVAKSADNSELNAICAAINDYLRTKREANV